MMKNRYIGFAMMAAVLLAATSCSEYDDYNTVPEDPSPSANLTLWENIKQNPQLSNFADLVKKVGFDEQLNTTHYYTVWAPVDGSYDAAALQNLSSKALMTQFVQNHIANYSFNASGAIDERVMMLNSKSYDFVGNASYSFDGVGLVEKNTPSSNGILHTLNGVAAYHPNLYQFITDEELSGAKGIDSLRNYVLHFENTYLDEEHSVPGPIMNGLQTYVDSVMITENYLWEMLRAKFQDEDSTYTFLMPTNEAWLANYEKIKEYYQYAPKTSADQFASSGGSVSKLSTPAVINIDASYWQDSITKRWIANNLIYSNKNAYNTWLEGVPTEYGSDTLRATTGRKLSNPQDIIKPTKEKVIMSNGFARIIDDLGFYPWETYAQERFVSAYTNDNRAMITAGETSRVEVINPNPEKVTLLEGESTYNYLWVSAGANLYTKPEATFYLPGVLSTTYEIYCIFVPENVDADKPEAKDSPNRVIFTLSYCDTDGSIKEKLFLNQDPDQIADFMAKFPTVRDNASTTNANHQTIRSFSNDTSKVDTLLIGEFTFPVCYAGLGDEYCPNIKISTPYSPFTVALRNAYTRDLRVAGFILRPKEYAEYLESNK